MKLSELSVRARECSGVKDPDIRIVTSFGFDDIEDILHRDQYRDQSFFGKELDNGDFVCLEVETH